MDYARDCLGPRRRCIRDILRRMLSEGLGLRTWVVTIEFQGSGLHSLLTQPAVLRFQPLWLPVSGKGPTAEAFCINGFTAWISDF